MKPVILLTVGTRYNENRGMAQFELFENYAEAITTAGGAPLLICTDDVEALASAAETAHGLFLTGGDDVAPEKYGEPRKPKCGASDDRRDAAELVLCEIFTARRKPILGVCRGLQLINVCFGGTLTQDLPSERGLSHPFRSVHEIETPESSWLRSHFPPKFIVNSYHHQAIDKLGEGLAAAAFSENGRVIEALEHESLQIRAVQWHPERMTGEPRYDPEGPDMAAIFRSFCDMCAKMK